MHLIILKNLNLKNIFFHQQQIDQCSFSLSSRKYYISSRDNKLLYTYRSSIIESALLLNDSLTKQKIDEYANQITDFEKNLAFFAKLPENRRNYSRIYNVSVLTF